MTEAMSRLIDHAEAARLLRRVDRAVAELRRGLPVVVCAADGNGIVLAAEQASDSALAELAADGAEPPSLVLTAERANVLRILPAGHDVQLVPIPAGMDLAALRELADPTRDLERPLRGPFAQVKAAPPGFALAAVRLCKIARLLPAAVTVPLAAPDPAAWASERDLLVVVADDVAGYEQRAATALVEVARAYLPLREAEAALMVAFRPRDGGYEHHAVIIGDPPRGAPVLTRLHSACFTGDLLGSMKCDCGEQLRGAISMIAAEGNGVLLYLAQEGRGIGLINKLRAYRLQDQGFDTIAANERLGFDADERLFEPAAVMLKLLGIDQVRLMTNNPDKVAGLERCGIAVAERVPHAFPANTHNEQYLKTKKKRSGHYL